MTEPLWRDLTHQQVWDQVHAGPGPYVSDSAATAWSNAQAALRQIDGDLDAAVTKAAGWTGAAADAARSGLTPLGNWAVDATGSAGRAAVSLTEHQEQVAWVRANLPEPGLAPGVDPPIPLSDAGVDPAVLQNWTVAVGRNAALADQAFHVMDTYASNTALIQQQVPTWTPPPAVTVSVSDRPPPSMTSANSPGRRAGTFPTPVAPAAALAVGGAAGGTASQNAPQRPASSAVTDGSAAGRLAPAPLSSITPTASNSAAPLAAGRAPAERDGSALPVAGAVAGRVLPDGSSVLRGLPDGAAPSAGGGAGVLGSPTARPGTAAPGGSDPQGVLRGLPDGAEPATGVLRGGPAISGRGGVPASQSGTAPLPFDQGSSSDGIAPPTGAGTRGGPGSGAVGGRQGNLGTGLLNGRSVPPGTGYPGSPTDAGGAYLGGRSAETGLGYPGGPPDLGTGVLGAHPGDPVRGGIPPADPQPAFGGGAATAASGRPGAESSPGCLPMGGVGLGNRGDTHRTPEYLVGSYAFFADDRRLAGPLITPEEPLPLRT